jgi:DmsE family decaheme c-type cytochrome
MRGPLRLLAAGFILAAGAALAGEAPPFAGLQVPADASFVGAKACLECHPEAGAFYAGSAHATAKTDAGAEGCEACHGPGSLHVSGGGDGFILGKKALGSLDADRRVSLCTQCHAAQRAQWTGGPHDGAHIGCAECHVDVAHFGGSVRATRALAEFRNPSEFCVQCHTEQVADFRLPFRHRALEGQMTCGDCHDPHRDLDAAGWNGLNEVCLKCHTEMAGPFVFAHDGVTDESCTACHRPHGSSHDKLLIQDGNGLCLSCHHESGFSSDGNWTLGGTAHRGLLANEARCYDCHLDVHGSNVSPTFRNQ